MALLCSGEYWSHIDGPVYLFSLTEGEGFITQAFLTRTRVFARGFVVNVWGEW